MRCRWLRWWSCSYGRNLKLSWPGPTGTSGATGHPGLAHDDLGCRCNGFRPSRDQRRACRLCRRRLSGTSPHGGWSRRWSRPSSGQSRRRPCCGRLTGDRCIRNGSICDRGRRTSVVPDQKTNETKRNKKNDLAANRHECLRNRKIECTSPLTTDIGHPLQRSSKMIATAATVSQRQRRSHDDVGSSAQAGCRSVESTPSSDSMSASASSSSVGGSTFPRR